MLGAGTGGAIAFRQVDCQPADTPEPSPWVWVAALGLWLVGGGAPGVVRAVFWALVIVSEIQFAHAVIRRSAAASAPDASCVMKVR
jgi:hypothetical protein